MEPVRSIPEERGGPKRGLESLAEVKLTPERAAKLERALATNAGTLTWRRRKRRELEELLALEQIAPPGRFEVAAANLHSDLCAVLELGVAVPCRAGDDIEVVERAILGLRYPEEALRRPLPGAAFFQILMPRAVWLPSVRWPEQPLCLGTTLGPAIRVRALVLMAYGALSMQTVQVDEADSAGVFNTEAALWWQRNLDRVPLSRTPFLATDDDVRKPPRAIRRTT